MSSINQQGTANPLSASDQLLVWSSANGDTRKTSITALLALFTASIPAAVPGVSTPALPVFLPFVGGSNAIIANAAVGVTIPAPYIGQAFIFFPAANNSGPATLQVGTNAAIAVLHQNLPCSGGEFVAGVPVLVVYDGVQYQLLTVAATLPTRQIFAAAGAAVWNRPPGCRQIRVRLKAPGGGGAGGADATNNGIAGTNGTDSTFNAIVAQAGRGGFNGYGGGTGGTSGATAGVVRWAGAPGTTGTSAVVSATNQLGQGGNGGGNGGGKTLNGGHSDGALNSGGGGSGGGVTSVAFQNVAPGSGGGEGEEIEIIISNPVASYNLVNGAAGVGGALGANGLAGGAGALGICIVDELY